jgi:hypothetical protein
VTSPNIAPSPDLTAYVDLRPFDLSDQAIVEAAIAALQLNLPGWIPREGNTEVLILESLALEMAEAIVAVNRLPGAVVQALLLLAGVDRDYGAAPIGSATFILGDTNGYTIPAGTRIYLPLENGTSTTFLVEPPGLVIPAGEDTGDVSIIGDTFTAAANGMPIGARMVMADPVPFIETVELATAVADGRDPETDNEWRDRGVERLSRLSDALVVPRHFEAAALERAEVARAVGIDLYDPTVGPSPGDNPGHMTVAVLGENGAALSTEAKDEIRTDMENRAVAVLDVHVVDVTLVTVPLTAQVHLLAGFDSTTTLAAVHDALVSYVDPLTWTWGGKIRRNEIISLSDRVDGVDYVIDVTINGVAGDYTISGPAVLPKAGTVTATAA